jgi:hypothetical protein
MHEPQAVRILWIGNTPAKPFWRGCAGAVATHRQSDATVLHAARGPALVPRRP